MKGGIEFRQLSNVHEKILSLQQTKVRPSILMIFPSCFTKKFCHNHYIDYKIRNHFQTKCVWILINKVLWNNFKMILR